MYTLPIVSYYDNRMANYTTLTGIQSVIIRRGRTYFQDPWSASSVTIELIPATSYAVPIEVGQKIDVRVENTLTGRRWFHGQITSVQRVYGMPYNTGTGYAPQDRIVITGTGGTGLVAMTNLSDIVSWGNVLKTAVQNVIETETTNRVAYYDAPQGDPRVSAQADPTGQTWPILNDLVRTGNRIVDDFDTPGGTVYNILCAPVGYNQTPLAFSDAGGGNKFTNIEFLSSDQTTFDVVTVNAAGLATQTARDPSYRNLNTLNVSTYNETTADALSLANYYLATLGSAKAPTPYKIRTNTELAANCLVPSYLANSVAVYDGVIGRAINVTFRGSTTTGVCQGVTLAFYPEVAAVEYTMAPSLGQPFTLDSSLFGILDTNRLGYP